MPPVKVWWYDGVENIPEAPKEMGPDPKIRRNGKYIYSKELTYLGGTHSDPLRIIPEDKYRELAVPVLGQGAAETLLDALWRVDVMDDINALPPGAAPSLHLAGE